MMPKNETMTFSHLKAEHIDQLAALEQLCFSDPWSRESLAQELDNPLSRYYLCLEGERVLGYIGTRQLAGEWEIVNVAVDPARRREHIASRLMEWLLRDAAAGQCERIFLEVRQSNLPAIGCYTRFGFRQVGLRKNYYEKPVENAILMMREETL